MPPDNDLVILYSNRRRTTLFAMQNPKSAKYRYSAIATIPPVHLSKRGTRWSVHVEAYEGKKFIGYFDIGGAGINFTKAHALPLKGASKPRPTNTLSWKQLTEQMLPH